MRSFRTAAISLWSGLAALAAAQSPPNSCFAVQIISDGSNESMRLAVYLLDVVAGVNITQVPYAQGADFASTVGPGASNLIGLLTSFSQACPSSNYILSGTGQGASIISAALAGTDLGGNLVLPLPSDVGQKVTAVVLYQDATQNPSIGDQGACDNACTTGTSLSRIGSYADALGVYSGRLQNWCTAADGSCCGTPGTIPANSASYIADKYLFAAVWFVKKLLGAKDLSEIQLSPSNLPTCAATTTTATSAPVQTSTPAPAPSPAEPTPSEIAAPPPPPPAYASPSDAQPPPAYVSEAAATNPPEVSPAPPAYVPPPPAAEPSTSTSCPPTDAPPATTPTPPPPAAAAPSPSFSESSLRPYRTLTNVKSVAGYATTAVSSAAAGHVSSASSASRLPLSQSSKAAAPSSATTTAAKGAGNALRPPSEELSGFMGLVAGLVGLVAVVM